MPSIPGTRTAPASQTELSQWSLEDPEGFWNEQAEAIDWHRPFDQACDFSNPPFSKWFTGGFTNLCHNAVDRHLPARAHQDAIIFESTETGEKRRLTYGELHREINRMAAVLQSLDLHQGDRVILYLPTIPEAAISMLACARLGLVHSVVFAGFAAESLAKRIRDAEARLIITCDASLRNGKVIRLKQTVDEALALSESAARVLMIRRGIENSFPFNPKCDVDYAEAARSFSSANIPPVWLESSEPSYILYTSGTTAQPKGIQRDTGGYAVALAASMEYIFGGHAGETFFSTADIGWVVGHSYNVYGPLIHGMSTVLFEGLPIHHDATAWWKIVEANRATVMFSSPTAMRILKKYGREAIQQHDLHSLRNLFIAGEPLDESTSAWLQDALPHVQIIDNYWQTETGWPILTRTAGCESPPSKPGSPGTRVYGYDAYIADDLTGQPLPRGQKGVLAIRLPLPPGCMSTVWKNDALFSKHYCTQFTEVPAYSTFDYAVQDEEGYFFILGRTDDVLNVAGHRIGTREIEEVLCSCPEVAEAAVIGVADEIKGQVIKCLAVLKHPEEYTRAEDRSRVAASIEKAIVTKLGAIARPAMIGICRQLPKTRSGKIVRRAILALAEGRSPGDLSTLEDPAALDHVRDAFAEAQKS